MIYTVTFNPSLDYTITIDDFALGKTNRTTTEQVFPGGKGINVSTVLASFGIENIALGFLAGFTGEEILRKVTARGLRHDFIWLKQGFSRINVKLKGYEGTEMNGRGPVIGPEELEKFLCKLETLTVGDVLVLAGSVAEGLPDTTYGDIMARLAGKGISFVVDASGQLLWNTLKYRPFLVKPNIHELEEIFGVSLETKEEIFFYAKKLQELGARNVLVSMAGEGAVFMDENAMAYQLQAPRGKLVNAVGAGDSMVAGFLAGWMEGKDYDTAFCMGVAAGSASAFSEGLATKEDVWRIYSQLC